MSTMMEGLPVAQEIEVTAKAARRRFSAAEKLRVLKEADRCTVDGHRFPRVSDPARAVWRAAAA